MSVFLLLVLAGQSDTAAINRFVRAEMVRQRIPGLSLAVLRGDSGSSPRRWSKYSWTRVGCHAAGYRLEDGVLKNQEWVAPLLNTTADGALYFTVRDLTRWAVALNHRRVPSRSALDTAWTPVRLSDGATYPYGFGWFLHTPRGQTRIAY